MAVITLITTWAYECGRDARRFTNGLVRWWDQHFFARREMN